MNVCVCVCVCESFVNFNYRCILCIFTMFAEQVDCMYLYLLEYCYRGNLTYFFLGSTVSLFQVDHTYFLKKSQ